MAPVATNPVYTPTSGFNTPESQLDGPIPSAPIHPTAARRPYSIVVNSENTTYSEQFITSKYENRGANVVTSADGQVNVVPTVKSYEFRTATQVQRTGCVLQS
jgi:myo-inositol-1-phosphate synthase